MNDQHVQDFGLRFLATLDPSFGKAAEDMVRIITKAAQRVSAAGSNLANTGAMSVLSSIESNERKILKLSAGVAVAEKQIDSYQASLQKMAHLEDRFKGKPYSKTFSDSKAALSQMGTPQEIADQISKIEGQLRRLDDLRERRNKGEKLPPLSDKVYKQLRDNETSLKAEAASLEFRLTKSQEVWKKYTTAKQRLMKQWTEEDKRLYTLLEKNTVGKQGGAELRANLAQQNTELQRALAHRQKLVKDYQEKLGLLDYRKYAQQLDVLQADRKPLAGDQSRTLRYTFQQYAELLKLQQQLPAEMQASVEKVKALPPALRQLIPPLAEIRQGWAGVAQQTRAHIELAEKDLEITAEIKKHLSEKNRLVGVTARGLETRYGHTYTNLSVRPKGLSGENVASRGQVATMIRLVEDLQRVEKQVNREKENSIRLLGKESQELTDLSSRIHKYTADISQLIVKQKELIAIEEKAQKNNRFTRNVATGLGMTRFNRLNSMWQGLTGLYRQGRDDESGVGGKLGGIKNVAMGVGVIAGVVAPLKAIEGALSLTTKAFGSFVNVVGQGAGVIRGFIQQASQAHQEVVQFALATGLSMDEAQKLNAIFKTLGLDTYWMAVGLESLNRAVIENNQAFVAMGIATRDAEGNARKITDVIRDLHDLYQGLDQEGRQNFLGNMQQQIPFLAMLMPLITTDYDKFLGPLEKLNVLLDETEQKSLTRVTSSITALNLGMDGLAKTVTIALQPAITAFANAILNILVDRMDDIQNFFEVIGANVKSFVDAIFGIPEIDFAESLAQGFESTNKAMQDAGGTMSLYQGNVVEAKNEISELDDQIEELNETIEDQQRILDDIQEAMEAELEPIREQQDAIKEALEAQLEPLEERLDYLEKSKEAWTEERDVALDSINDQTEALRRRNKELAKAEELELSPLESQLESLQGTKKAFEKAHRNDGSEDDPFEASIDEKQDAIKAIDKQIQAIRKADQAWSKAQNRIIKDYQRQDDAIDDQIKAIRKQEDVAKKALEAQRKLIQDQIDAVNELGDAQTQAAEDQAYYDQRAYLMGQTLLAQMEARQRSLGDRQARQRGDGETDVDYQLRMMQLNLQNDIEGEQRANALAELDQQRALELANRLREEQVELLQAQIEAMEDSLNATLEANANTIDGLEAQKEHYSELIDAIREAMDARQEESDVALEGLEAQKEALQEQLDALREMQEAAREAKEAADKAIEAAAQALDDQIEAVQDQIDAIKKRYDDLKEINDDAIEGLEDQAEAVRDKYDPIIEAIDKEIKGIKTSVDEFQDAANKKVKELEKIEKAIEKAYKPQIEAQKDVIKGLRDELDELRDKQRELKKAAQLAEELRLTQKKAAEERKKNDPFGNFVDPYGGGDLTEDNYDAGIAPRPAGIGARFGDWVRDTFIAPFEEKGTIKEALKEVIRRLWEDIGPLLSEGGKKSIELMVDAILLALEAAARDTRIVSLLAIATGLVLLGIPPPLAVILGAAGAAFLDRAMKEMGIKGFVDDVLNALVDAAMNPKILAMLAIAVPLVALALPFVLALIIGATGVALGSAAVGAASPAIRAVKDFVEDVWNGLVDVVTNPKVTGILKKAVKLQMKGIPLPLGLIIAFAEEMGGDLSLGGLVSYGGKVKDFFLEEIWQPFENFVTETLPKWLGKGKDMASSILEGLANGLASIGTFLWDNLAKPVITNIDDWIKSGGKLFLAFAALWAAPFTQGLDKFKNIGTWLWDNFGNPIVTFFSDLPDKIGKAFSGLWGKVSAPIKQVYGGFKNLVDGITNAVNGIYGFVAGGKKLITESVMKEFTEPSSGVGGADLISQGGHGLVAFARGGRVDGPTKALIGEASHPEYVLTTDPKHKKRTGSLLGQFLGEWSGKAGVGGPPDIPGVHVNLPEMPGWIPGLEDAAKINKFFTELFNGDKLKDQFFGMLNKFLPDDNSMLLDLMRSAGSYLLSTAWDWIMGTQGKVEEKLSTGQVDLANMFKAGGYPTQGYGETNYAKLGYASGFHSGVDIANPTGTPLYAPGLAAVMKVGNQGDGYGLNMVLGLLKSGFFVVIAHLNKVMVHMGEVISDMNKVIALVGGDRSVDGENAGNSTGSHTHVETINPKEGPVNPEKFLPQWSSFWNMPGFAKGGAVKPNSFLTDIFGRPYAKVGEAGELEYVMPRSIMAALATGGIQAGLRTAAGNVPAKGIGAGGNSYTLNIAKIEGGDPEATAQAVIGKWEAWLDELPVHAGPVLVGGNR